MDCFGCCCGFDNVWAGLNVFVFGHCLSQESLGLLSIVDFWFWWCVFAG